MIPLLAPLLAAGASGIGSYFANRRSRNQQQQQMPQQQQGQPGQINSQQIPGGTTLTQTPRFTPDQSSMMQQLMQQGFGGMQNLPQADFDPIRQQAMSQFNQEIVPGLAEQFSGAGAGGQRSSAFEQALGGAGAGLSERLAAMQQGFNMQNRGQEQQRLLSMLGLGLQPQFENAFIPKGQSGMSSIMGGLAQGIGSMAPMAAMHYFGK